MPGCSDERPIFVRGLSRSGGTLMVTVLDAHPQVSMSYELYPTLLEDAPDPDGLTALAQTLRRTRMARSAVKAAPTKGMGTFLARCARSGVDHQAFAELLGAHLDAGDSFDDIAGRMKFIERCALEKARREGKPYWGLKCNNQYADYLGFWPKARFVNMVRDGRDVLSSQLNTGSFGKSPSEVATSWSNTHRKFRQLLREPKVLAEEVFYERLARAPREALTEALAGIGLEFHDRMLAHHTADLTVYKSSHLSMEQLKKPISDTQVGRWRADLSRAQLEEFEAVAGDMLEELGYEKATVC
jgi:hypothetical protein